MHGGLGGNLGTTNDAYTGRSPWARAAYELNPGVK